MVFKFKEKGTTLGSRVLGESLRKSFEEAIKSNKRIIFDFEGVTIVSHSFADECFGKLLQVFDFNQLKAHTTFRNANSEIQNTIKFTLNERAAEYSC